MVVRQLFLFAPMCDCPCDLWLSFIWSVARPYVFASSHSAATFKFLLFARWGQARFA